MKKDITDITLRKLEMEVENLRKKIFVYETLLAEKEIKEGKISGPYKDGKSVIKRIKK